MAVVIVQKRLRDVPERKQNQKALLGSTAYQIDSSELPENCAKM
jgi:hypothetical protein